jgi:hypothetical protein
MANRSIQQKMLKMKRRNRFAVFSGATTKYASRTVEVLHHEGEDKVSVKRIEVLVGNVSLSKAVISTGRGPSQERMAEYYHRVNHESYTTKLAEDEGIKHPTYIHKYWDLGCFHSIKLVENDFGRLHLFFSTKVWFFVDVDYRKGIVRRSRDYGSKAFAMARLQNKMVTWVDTVIVPK